MTRTSGPDSAIKTAKVAIFSVDPPGFTTFHSFDPDSFTVISAVNDALIYIDNDGDVRPALATAWRRVSPTEMEFSLRQGVAFHNGEVFDADSVVATFHAHKHPVPSAGGRGVLGPVVCAIKVDDYTVRIRTAFPDAMLLRRLFFSSIYPKSILERDGRDALAHHPIGTGPYRFHRYDPGREIVLVRNADHWSGMSTVDRLRLPILRQKEWVDRLSRGEIDMALGIDCHDRVRATRIAGLVTASRPAAISQWFLLKNAGPLADVRVRRALNHAINRSLLVDVTTHGFGAPQRAVATEGQEGYTEVEAYRYSPELTRRLLEEAGHGSGFTLRGIVSETSTPVYFMVKEFLSRVGVGLEAEIVPRGEWLRRIVGGHLSGKPYTGDFALAAIDNPILHTLFHHFIFLSSHGPFSLLHDEEYDRAFMAVAAAADDAGTPERLAQLERYVRDQALVLFTVKEHVHAAFREGFSCTMPASGHFQVASLLTIRASDRPMPASTLPPTAVESQDHATLLDATSHTGTFFLKPGEVLKEPILQRVWDNIRTSELRWRLEGEPMMRELVSQAEAKVNLANVLGSTERVAIAGYSAEGQQLFVNRGYKQMLGEERSVFHHLGTLWPAIRDAVSRTGGFVGSVHLASDGRPRGAPDRLYLSVTRAVDNEGLVMGHTFVLSDFSGEEERIRNQAIRTILDNVPYGLCMCDARGIVLDGYSDACAGFFIDPSAGISGRSLPDLLGMGARDADAFLAAYEQIFEDLMPEELSLANLPERVAVRERTFSLSAAVVRDAEERVGAVIFTVIDITLLQAAERENEQLRGAVKVMRFRPRFEEFALGLYRDLLVLEAMGAGDPPEFQRLARRALHTAKGVLAQFGLGEIAREIHTLEDHAQLTSVHLRQLANSLSALLARNEDLWGIRLQQVEPRYETVESRLVELETWVAAAESPAEMQRRARAIFAKLREKTVRELVGPLADGCAQLAERQGKRVQLALHGTELRFPAELCEIFSVLPHLLRNCIDHGIEPPSERGDKPEIASVRLDFSRSETAVRIVVADDGRGIAKDKVVARALQLGAISEADLAHMDEAQQLRLIFVGGLSTAHALSETSGRGVGMDAVDATVRALGGQIRVHSVAGAGTVFELDLPVATAP